MKPANDDEFFAESVGDWVMTLLTAVGALTAFFVALAVTL